MKVSLGTQVRDNRWAVRRSSSSWNRDRSSVDIIDDLIHTYIYNNICSVVFEW